MMIFNRQRGSITVMAMSVIMLVGIAIIIFYIAGSSSVDQKIYSNSYRTKQAFEAAEAGLEFGLAYLNNNKASIVVDTNSDGYIDTYTSTATQNVTLNNGSIYTVSYSNPITSNFDIVKITSVGKSADGTATRTVSQLVASDGLINPLNTTYTSISRQGMLLQGNPTLTNTYTNQNIRAGGAVTFSGSASTVTSSGGSSSGHVGSDVVQNDTSISGLSSEAFFETFFNATEAQVQAQAALPSSSGKLIWINGDSSYYGGTQTNPVIVIVTGNYSSAGNTSFYGILYVMGNVTLNGTENFTGTIISEGTTTTNHGTVNVTYNPTIVSNANHNLSTTYSKIAGSWNDLNF